MATWSFSDDESRLISKYHSAWKSYPSEFLPSKSRDSSFYDRKSRSFRAKDVVEILSRPLILSLSFLNTLNSGSISSLSPSTRVVVVKNLLSWSSNKKDVVEMPSRPPMLSLHVLDVSNSSSISSLSPFTRAIVKEVDLSVPAPKWWTGESRFSSIFDNLSIVTFNRSTSSWLRHVLIWFNFDLWAEIRSLISSIEDATTRVLIL